MIIMRVLMMSSISTVVCNHRDHDQEEIDSHFEQFCDWYSHTEQKYL